MSTKQVDPEDIFAIFEKENFTYSTKLLTGIPWKL